MIVSAIVAVAENQVIGIDNQMPWHLPTDLKYFKRKTLGHHIIMGRKNFQSIGHPLPGRTNIVISRNPYFTASNCLVAHSIEEALEIALENGETEAFIIGGGNVYSQSMPLLDRIYLTRIAYEPEGDVFFPELKKETWELVSEEAHQADDRNPYAYNFQVFERR